RPGAPAGETIEFDWKDGAIYPGTSRKFWLHVPMGYSPAEQFRPTPIEVPPGRRVPVQLHADDRRQPRGRHRGQYRGLGGWREGIALRGRPSGATTAPRGDDLGDEEARSTAMTSACRVVGFSGALA
ncbi:hypothetical protein ACWIF5_17155, partial [Streptomyces sp. NPDC055509]